MVLVYPVISLTAPSTHVGSLHNLLGDKPDQKMVESLSNEKQVTADTPPTFLVASTADTVVPAENSVQFYLALRQAKVPAEFLVQSDSVANPPMFFYLIQKFMNNPEVKRFSNIYFNIFLCF